MDDGVDRRTCLNALLSELVCPDSIVQKPLGALKQLQLGSLKQLQVTDCTSPYDAVISKNPSLEEKRTLISVRSIQDVISPHQFIVSRQI